PAPGLQGSASCSSRPGWRNRPSQPDRGGTSGPLQIEGDADGFHQMGDQDVRCRACPGIRVHGGAVHGVAARRISAIRPVHETVHGIELEIDRLRQTVVQHLNVCARCRTLTPRDVDTGAKDAAASPLIRTLLRPVDLTAIRIHGYTDTPFGLVAPVSVALTRLHD